MTREYKKNGKYCACARLLLYITRKVVKGPRDLFPPNLVRGKINKLIKWSATTILYDLLPFQNPETNETGLVGAVTRRHQIAKYLVVLGILKKEEITRFQKVRMSMILETY